MRKYYAIGNTSKGNSQLISFEDMGDAAPKTLFHAEELAIAECKRKGLVFQYAQVIQGTQKQGSTLTKFKKLRQQTGNNGKYFSKAL